MNEMYIFFTSRIYSHFLYVFKPFCLNGVIYLFVIKQYAYLLFACFLLKSHLSEIRTSKIRFVLETA